MRGAPSGSPSKAGLAGALLGAFFASAGYILVRTLLVPIRLKLLMTLLTKEDYASLNLVSSSVSMVVVFFSMGSLEFMVRRLPGREPAYQMGVFRFVLLVFGAVSLALAAAAAIGVALWRDNELGLSPLDAAACGALIALTMHVVQRIYYLLGQTQYTRVRILQLLYADLWFVPVLLFWWLGTVDMTAVLWTWVGWLLLSIGATRRWIRLGNVFAVRPSPVGLGEVLRFGLPLLPMIAGEWLLRFQDQYFLLSLMDPESVAEYVMCRNVALIGFMVGASVLEIMCTELFRLRNQLGSDDLDVVAGSAEVRRNFSAMFRFTLIVWLPLAIVMTLAPEDIIRVISDPEKYLAAASIMPWTTPIPLLFLIWMILSRTLMAFDRTRVIGAVTLAGALLSGLLHLLLIPLVGEAGAALAATLSLTMVNGVLAVRLKAWRWIALADLMPTRSLLLTAVAAGGFSVLQPLLPGGSLVRLLACGGWCLGCTVALGMLKRSDLRLVAAAFGTSDDEGR